MSSADRVSEFNEYLRRELRRTLAVAVGAAFESWPLTEPNRDAIVHAYLVAREAANAQDVDGASIEAEARLTGDARLMDGDPAEIYKSFRAAIRDARLAAMDAVPVSTPVKVGDKIADAVTRGDWMGVATMICNPKGVS